MNNSTGFREIERLWREHCAATFPEGFGGPRFGVEVAQVDTFAAGCIDTFIACRGNLDLRRTAILGLCHRDLAVAVVGLQGDAQAYVARLENLVRLVLESVRDGARQA
jgi:hypothetical protein